MRNKQKIALLKNWNVRDLENQLRLFNSKSVELRFVPKDGAEPLCYSFAVNYGR